MSPAPLGGWAEVRRGLKGTDGWAVCGHCFLWKAIERILWQRLCQLITSPLTLFLVSNVQRQKNTGTDKMLLLCWCIGSNELVRYNKLKDFRKHINCFEFHYRRYIKIPWVLTLVLLLKVKRKYGFSRFLSMEKNVYIFKREPVKPMYN